MKQLKFQHIYAEAIRNGEKTTSLRVADDKDLRVGDSIQIVDKVDNDDPQSWLVIGQATIESVSEYYLEAIPAEELKKTELGKSSSDEIIAFLKRFYGNDITSKTPVKLIHFSFQPFPKETPYLVRPELSQQNPPEEVKLFADGGSRGNPGPSASGYVVLTMDDIVIREYNHYLGITTNNQAEYHALLAGLEWCRDNGIKSVHVHLDSLLAINQMKGIYKVKNRDLWSLYERAKEVVSQIERVTFTHVPRELNKRADAEVNKALDAIKGNDAVQ